MNYDELSAHKEYVDQRLSELRSELAAREEALGMEVSRSTIPAIMANVVNTLRARGRHELASEFQISWETFDRGCGVVEARQAAGHTAEEESVAMEDALETFQRVEAQVSAALDLGGTGH